MKDTPKLTLAFTGHRPDKLAGYEREKYRAFTDELADLLYQQYYQHGYRKFITGGAQGFDQLAFWSVEKMRRIHKLDDVENIVYIPFQGQESRWKDEGCFSKNDYKKMLCAATRTQVLLGPLAQRNEIVAALMARNRAMVDAANTVLALCLSSSWKEDKGGTAAAMRYAATKKVQLDQLGALRDAAGNIHIDNYRRDIAK